MTDNLQEISPIISIDDEILEEGRDFSYKKHANGVLDIFYHPKRMKIQIQPGGSASGIIYAGSDKPRFYFDGVPVPVDGYTIFSHMQGQFPGVTIRFLYGAPIKMMQIIPRVVDAGAEKRKRQAKDYEYYLTRGRFPLDYFKEYGIGTTTPEEDKAREKAQEEALEQEG